MWKQDTSRHTFELLLNLLASLIKFTISTLPANPMKTENQWDIKGYCITFTLTGKGCSTNPDHTTKYGLLKDSLFWSELVKQKQFTSNIYLCQENKLTNIFQAVCNLCICCKIAGIYVTYSESNYVLRNIQSSNQEWSTPEKLDRLETVREED